MSENIYDSQTKRVERSRSTDSFPSESREPQTSNEVWDLIVIGAGPGGYVAAERAGALGKKVLLVEKENLGGVCTNHGCIPTKSLLNAAKHLVYGRESGRFGVHFDNPRFDFSQAMAWKNDTVETLRQGIAFLMKQHKVTVVFGEASFSGAGADGFQGVTVNGEEYRGQNLLLATGSEALVPPIPGADLPHVLTNREILNLKALPEKLVVIGGGVIGVEFASFFSSVGVEVQVVEMMPEICPMMDKDVARTLRKQMKEVTFHLSARVTAVTAGGITFVKGDQETSIEADAVLMAVGRRPRTEGLEALGLEIRRTGIRVDEKMRTNIPGIYAAGDVTGESLLAHSASRMGEVAVNVMFGGEDRMRTHAIPWAVYTLPEAAGCGLTEAQAKEKGYNVKRGTLHMRANGRFLAEHGKEAGFVKIIADAETDLVLGVHMIGAVCSEMIGTVATFMEAELRTRDIKEIIFPHPSVSEVIRDACWTLR